MSDFQRSVGRLVQVTARRKASGTRTLVGVLASCGQEGITLEVDGREVFIFLNDIAKAKLKPKF
jgi:ribosome maturation factor RimP